MRLLYEAAGRSVKVDPEAEVIDARIRCDSGALKTRWRIAVRHCKNMSLALHIRRAKAESSMTYHRYRASSRGSVLLLYC